MSDSTWASRPTEFKQPKYLPLGVTALDCLCGGTLDTDAFINFVLIPPPDTGCANSCHDASDGYCDDGGAGSENEREPAPDGGL